MPTRRIGTRSEVIPRKRAGLRSVDVRRESAIWHSWVDVLPESAVWHLRASALANARATARTVMRLATSQTVRIGRDAGGRRDGETRGAGMPAEHRRAYRAVASERAASGVASSLTGSSRAGAVAGCPSAISAPTIARGAGDGLRRSRLGWRDPVAPRPARVSAARADRREERRAMTIVDRRRYWLMALGRSPGSGTVVTLRASCAWAATMLATCGDTRARPS